MQSWCSMRNFKALLSGTEVRLSDLVRSVPLLVTLILEWNVVCAISRYDWRLVQRWGYQSFSRAPGDVHTKSRHHLRHKSFGVSRRIIVWTPSLYDIGITDMGLYRPGKIGPDFWANWHLPHDHINSSVLTHCFENSSLCLGRYAW